MQAGTSTQLVRLCSTVTYTLIEQLARGVLAASVCVLRA